MASRQLTIEMLKTAVILVLLSLSANGDIYQICGPLQWEGVQFVVTGTEEAGRPTMIQSTTKFSFDANNSRIAASTSGFQDGLQFQKDFLFLYQQKTVFVIEEGKCHAENLVNDFPPHCLPSNFTCMFARTWYGFETKDDELLLYGYAGHVDDLNYHVQLFIEFVTPASQQILGNYNDHPIFQTSEIVNTTRGIKNPDVFTLPASCKTA
ncbi:mammalian ependymin-related protein 1-like [Haliotis rufescens]|uniref:mammalian ependymin-related protein 1-like n=1 Tax=Haliotis rufescens TaxID=6454 RepID=UPI00201F7359|nr:mammalian ependymin-related protein 1-like [Haliotis rufescens]